MLFDLNERLGVVIVSVDYRLAPEAKYNASILDLEAVAHAIRDERYDVFYRRPSVDNDCAVEILEIFS